MPAAQKRVGHVAAHVVAAAAEKSSILAELRKRMPPITQAKELTPHEAQALIRQGPATKPDTATGPDPRPRVRPRPEEGMIDVPGYSPSEPWTFEWNAGQLEVQRRAGRSKDADVVKAAMDPEFKMRFAPIMNRQRVAFVGSLAPDGHPWASALVAPRDEEAIFSITPNTNRLEVQQPAGTAEGGYTCPVYAENTKEAGSPMVVLAVDFQRRMRFRANGHVAVPGPIGTVSQVATRNNFINCSSFIPKVDMSVSTAADKARTQGRPPNVEHLRGTSLSPEQQAMISSAFCIYLATAEGPKGPRVDLNIRGGQPGFVRVRSPNQISFPDYPGNGSFITLGNMTQYKKCGIIFPFVQSGGFGKGEKPMLQVVGGVEIRWDPGNCDEGMDRDIIINVEQVLETRGVDELMQWELKEQSSFAPPIGVDSGWWHRHGTAGVYKLGEVCPNVMRFSFSAQAKTRWHWIPGQYASMVLPNPEGGEPMHRAFTVAQMQPRLEPDGRMTVDGFGCYIKVFGRATKWLYDLPVDDVQVMGGDSGTEVQVTGLDGGFSLDVMQVEAKVPGKILMLSAGVGITPMLAMLSGLKFARNQGKQRYPVDVVLIHSSRTRGEILDGAKMDSLAAETRDLQKNPQWENASIRCEWTLTGPGAELGNGPQWHQGRLTEELLMGLVPDLAERRVYVCGPEQYMDDFVELVNRRGVPLPNIYTESFDQ